MSEYITRIRTATGARRIDYNALANKPIKMTTVSLPVLNWVGDASPYSQIVNISGIASTSKIDLQPTPAQLLELQDNETTLVAANENGVITIYVVGGKPTKDYEMQIIITDVEVIE